MATDFRGTPGVYSGNSLTPRNIFVDQAFNQVQYFPSFVFLDGANTRDTGSTPTDQLRAGLVLGKVAATGKYRNSIIGLTTGAVTAGTVTSITVGAATAAEVARLITAAAGNVSLKLIGPPTSGGTVATQAVTATAASGTTITISSATLAAAVVGSIIAPADGSQTPVTVLSNPFGVSVLDTTGTSVDQPLNHFLRGADLIATQVINLTEGDAATQAWVKAALKATGPFTFDNDR